MPLRRRLTRRCPPSDVRPTFGKPGCIGPLRASHCGLILPCFKKGSAFHETTCQSARLSQGSGRNSRRVPLPDPRLGPRRRRPPGPQQADRDGRYRYRKSRFRRPRGVPRSRRRAVRGRLRRRREASAMPLATAPTTATTTAIARPTTTSATCWPAPISTPSIVPRPTIGTRSW